MATTPLPTPAATPSTPFKTGMVGGQYQSASQQAWKASQAALDAQHAQGQGSYGIPDIAAGARQLLPPKGPPKPAPAVNNSDAAGTKVINAQNQLPQNQPLQKQPIGAPTASPSAAPVGQAETDAIDTEFNSAMGMFDAQAARLDARSQQMIQDIKNKYTARKQEAQDINKRELGGQTVAGIRAGRNRYAPEVEQGILSSTEAAGLKRLTALDQEEQSLISEATMANEDQQFDILVSKMDAAKAKRQEKQQVIQQLQDQAMKVEQFNMQKKQFNAEQNKDMQTYIDKRFERFGSAAFDGLSDDALHNLEAQAGIPFGTLSQDVKTTKELEKAAKSGYITVAPGSTIFDPVTGKVVYSAPLKPESQPAAIQEYEYYNSLSAKEKEAYDAYQAADAKRKANSTDPLIVKGRELENEKKELEIDALRSGKLTGIEAVKQEMSLRKEFNDLATVKQFTSLDNSYEGMQSALNQALKMNATKESKSIADQALITMYNKILDPNSVVREGEYDRTAQGQSLLGRAESYLEKLKQGGAGITDDIRREMVNVAGELYKVGAQNYEEVASQYKDIAEQTGLSTENVLGQTYGKLVEKKAAKFIKDNPAYANLKDQVREYLQNHTEAELLENLKNLKKKAEVGNNDADLASFDTGEGTFEYGKVAYTGYQPEEITKALDIDPKTFRAQCGRLINGATGIGVGDSYESKLAKTDPKITGPVPGLVFVMPTSEKWGHTGIVAGISADGKNILAYDANWNSKGAPETVSVHEIPMSKITGYAVPKEGSKLYKFATDQLNAKKYKPSLA